MAPGQTPRRSLRARQAWALVAGIGVGASGFLGGTDVGGAYGRSTPLVPGGTLRLFTGVQLSPLRALVISFELDLLLAMGASTSNGSAPSSHALEDRTPNSFGGGLTTIVRVHPAGGPFVLSGVFRVGAQRFEVESGGDSVSQRYMVLQPGIDVRLQLKRAELALRGTFGVGASDHRSNLYTVVMNVGFLLAGRASR